MFASSIVIQNDRNEILLVQEADPRIYGQWNLPGGRAEPAESPLDTACREVREEVGLEVRPSGLLGVYRHADGNLNFVFLARVGEGELPAADSKDILSLRWFPVSDALTLPPEQVLRHRKLGMILQDLREGRQSPCDIVRNVPPEHWEA